MPSSVSFVLVSGVTNSRNISRTAAFSCRSIPGVVEMSRFRYGFATEVDVLRLHDAFFTWRDDFLEPGRSDLQEAIVTQGRFSLISSCALLVKVRRKLVGVSVRNQRDEWRRELTRNDIDGPLFATDGNVDLSDSTVTRLNGLFNSLVEVHGSVVESENVGKLYKSEDFHVATLTPRLIDRFQDEFLGRHLREALDAFS